MGKIRANNVISNNFIVLHLISRQGDKCLKMISKQTSSSTLKHFDPKVVKNYTQ